MQATVINSERGFTLVETMVAAAVAGVGLLLSATLFTQLARNQRAAQGASGFSDYVSLVASSLAYPDISLSDSCTKNLHLTLGAGDPATLTNVPASITVAGSPLLTTVNVANSVQGTDGNIYSLTFSGNQVAQYAGTHILPSTHQPSGQPITLYHGTLTLEAQSRGANARDILAAPLVASIPISLELAPSGNIASCSTRMEDTDLAPPSGGGNSVHSVNDCMNAGGVPIQGSQGALTCHFVNYQAAYDSSTSAVTAPCPEGFSTSGNTCIAQSPAPEIQVPPCPAGWVASPGSQNTVCTQTTASQTGSCPAAIPCPEPESITPIVNSTMASVGDNPTYDTSGMQVYLPVSQIQNVTPPQPAGSPIPPTATCVMSTTCKFNTSITCPTAPSGVPSTNGGWVQSPEQPGTCVYQITSCPPPMQLLSPAPLTCNPVVANGTMLSASNPGTTGDCPAGWSRLSSTSAPGGATTVNCQ